MAKIVSTGLVGICLACFLVSGCGDRSEPPEAEPEAVVRQIMPVEATLPDEVPSSEAPPEAPPDDAGATAVEPDAGPDAGPETREDEQMVVDAPDQEAMSPESDPTEATEEEDSDASDLEMPDSEAGIEPAPVIELDFDLGDAAAKAPGETPADEDGAVSAFYNPFAPLFKREAAASTDMGDVGFREKRKFLTPLERIDLGQLQLDGIILAQSGNRAIVTDATGKGYVITRGTFIGLNSGIVESIESDRVVVSEDIGNRANKVVLKLQKPAGE